MILDGTNGITTNAGTLISASTIGVGGTTPSTSGAGISFPAALSASTDANTLDDYEEGTWTPTVTSQLGSITTVSSSSGTYTKIGRSVSIRCNFVISNFGTGAGAFVVNGLPFSVSTITVGVAENSSMGVVGPAETNAGTLFYISKYDGTTLIANNTFNASIVYFV